ncbi:hypothetical protein MRB53_020111 [Persea americana]|uniref:Uncharacterized protein n=1 Tax=Persea americana TaxID=3435 RepID=A0ACC2L191_PERAE|nr:hypothetical protein MRB53_020111 [Persea americana]
MACTMHFLRVGFQKTQNRSTRFSTSSASPSPRGLASTLSKFSGPRIRSDGRSLRRGLVQIAAMDEDWASVSSFDDWDDNEGISGRNSSILSSSDGEDSDTELLVIPTTEVDLPHRISSHLDRSDAVTAAAYQFASLRRRRKNFGMQPGVFINMGLIAFSVMLLLFVDWCSWKIVRLPLPSFYLTRPFFISAFLASCAGVFFVPLLDSLKVHQIIRKEGPPMHTSKRGTPTMGGLFFIPIGVTVAITIVGLSSVEVYGAAAATLAFAAIGLLDDILSFIRNHNYGLPAQTKLFLQVVVGACFSFWLGTADISSPYSMYTFL